MLGALPAISGLLGSIMLSFYLGTWQHGRTAGLCGVLIAVCFKDPYQERNPT